MDRPSGPAAATHFQSGINDAADVAPFLLSRGLLETRAIVDGHLRIEDASRRNRVFLVTTDGVPGCVVKLASVPGDRGVEREAMVLERLTDAALAPDRLLHDADTGALVMTLPQGARDLSEHHGGGRFPVTLARAAGTALAALHALPPRVLDGVPAADPHLLLAIHRPDLAMFRGLSAAGVELLRLIQASGRLCEQLDELLGALRRESVVHGDLRWDNLLAVPRPGSRRRTRVLLVDWELAAVGDPALDVGAYLAECLRAWRRYAGVPDPHAPGRRLVDPLRALPGLWPAVAAFWTAYGGDAVLLHRAVRCAGARLVLDALEETQSQSGLDENARATLQLGANVLARPEDAAVHLLGLPGAA